MILISLSVKTGWAVKLSSAGLTHGSMAQAAPTAAHAMRAAVRFAPLVSETMTCTPCSAVRGCETRAYTLPCYQNSADARPCLLEVDLRELAERAGSPIIQGIAAAEGGHMIASQGAVPIIRSGVVDGACGVGGGTAQQDEDCARAGVAKL